MSRKFKKTQSSNQSNWAHLRRWGRGRVHVVRPTTTLLQRGPAPLIRDFDADIVFALCHQDFDWRRVHAAVELDGGAHRVFEEFKADVVQVGRHIAHFDVVTAIVL